MSDEPVDKYVAYINDPYGDWESDWTLRTKPDTYDGALQQLGLLVEEFARGRDDDEWEARVWIKKFDPRRAARREGNCGYYGCLNEATDYCFGCSGNFCYKCLMAH